MSRLLRVIFLVTIPFLGGCSSFTGLSGYSSPAARTEHAESIAGSGGFVRDIIRTSSFRLLTFHDAEMMGSRLTVYIEGDGLAFTGRGRVSVNPSPVNPIGLKLALLDPSSAVIYIARPCQFIPLDEDPGCASDYWTVKRYAPEVVDAVGEVIDHYMSRNGFTSVRLVGYSGGGTVAAVLAATRDDVQGLVTLAGNLDIDTFVKIHHVTPLTGSMNPVDFAGRLVRVPQLHLAGRDDSVITPLVLQAYLASLKSIDNNLGCVTARTEDGVSHFRGWEAVWQRYSGYDLKCRPEAGD